MWCNHIWIRKEARDNLLAMNMRMFFRITVLLLCVSSAHNCIAQSGAYEQKDRFRLAPEEAKKYRVKSSASVVHRISTNGDTTSEYGEYFVYDRNGRVVAEMSNNLLKTFRFDSLSTELAESRWYKANEADYYSQSEPHALKTSDLDSVVNNSTLVKSIQYLKGAEIHTIEYDDYGRLGWEKYTEPGKDSTVRVVDYNYGTRTVSILRSDGTLLTDTVDSSYEQTIRNCNEHGDVIYAVIVKKYGEDTVERWTDYKYDAKGRMLEMILTERNENGKKEVQSIIQYKYDEQGREIECVQKIGNGTVARSTRRSFSPSGALDSLAIRVEDGHPLFLQNYTLEIRGRDTIMISRLVNYESGQSTSVIEGYSRIDGDSNYAEGFSKTYIIDSTGRMIGDTSITHGIRYYNKAGQTLSWITTKDGIESSRMTGKYDKKGRPLEYTYWDATRTRNESFVYYKNGTLKTHTESAGSFTIITNYNEQGKIISKIVNDPKYSLTSYTYNKNGLLIVKEVFLYEKLVDKIEFTYEYY